MEVGRKGRKHSDRVGIARGWNGDHNLSTPNVQPGGIGMDTGELVKVTFAM